MNSAHLANRLSNASRWLCGLLLGWGLACSAAWAQDDPPGRVGRLVDFQGNVSWFDHEQGQWSQAERNLPLTGGDRVATGPQATVELRIGSSALRVGGGSEIEVLRLDDQRISVQLHAGSLAVRIRSRDIAQEIELVTAEARAQPLTAGHYRLDRIDDTTQLSSWRGDVRVDDAAGFVLVAGQRVDLHREPRTGELRVAWTSPANDAFAAWVERDELQDARSASARYVSPEMTGAEDLDRHGRWEQHPEYGAVWLPLSVQVDWAPYRYGRWQWVRPWGWTWVDDARWGFAPFHYGRWANWRGRWCWVPGAYVARPVYAPALVAWVGGPPGVSVSVRIGGGFGGASIGWVALAPREVFVPRYGVTVGYRERVNPEPPYRWHHPPHRPPTGPIIYGNQGVPNGVTVVSQETLLRRQPIAPAWERERGNGRGDGRGEGRSRGDDPRRPGDHADFSRQPLKPVAPPAPSVTAPAPGYVGPPRPAFPREPGRVERGPAQPPISSQPKEPPPSQTPPVAVQPVPVPRAQARPPWQGSPQPGAAVVVPPEDRRDMPQRPDGPDRGAPGERRERGRPVADAPLPVPAVVPAAPVPAMAPAAPMPRAPVADKPVAAERQERVQGPERPRAPERDRERPARDPDQRRQNEGKNNARERENLR